MKNLKEIPDTNFRNKLKRLFYNAFENELLDINNDEIIKCKKLYVSVLEIKDLTGIEWFINLKGLWCYDNQLTFLPKLPNTLKTLHCFDNRLTTLSNLPSTLKELYYRNNQLTTLPKLPDTLKNLDCSDNQLTSLPNLPDRLVYLVSNNNMLPPATLPKNLSYFEWYIYYINKNNQEEGECLKYVLNK